MSVASSSPSGPDPFPPRSFVERMLARIRNGDEDAVRELVAALERFVRREAHALLRGPCRAREQTEDIAQDVLMSLLQKFPAIESHDHLLATTRRMISHQVNDVYTRHLRDCRDVRREAETTDGEDSADAAADHAVTPPPVAAERSESIEYLRIVLDMLRPLDRRIFDAAMAGGSPAEIGRSLGKSPDFVRMRRNRAIAEVQRAWHRRFPGQPLPDLGTLGPR
jgi:RNA polymerase sigma factor (sigma-70 family)